MHYTDDLAGAIGHARRFAERGLELDPLDPFVNFTMGRTYWLEGDLDTSLGLARARDRHQPALRAGHLRTGLDRSAGRASRSSAAARRSGDAPEPARSAALRDARHARVHAHGLDEDVEAAHWAERGARSPGAHVLIAMIAAAAHALDGRHARAAFWAANVRERNAALTREDFFRAFPMKSDATRARRYEALARAGFAEPRRANSSGNSSAAIHLLYSVTLIKAQRAATHCRGTHEQEPDACMACRCMFCMPDRVRQSRNRRNSRPTSTCWRARIRAAWSGTRRHSRPE